MCVPQEVTHKYIGLQTQADHFKWSLVTFSEEELKLLIYRVIDTHKYEITIGANICV